MVFGPPLSYHYQVYHYEQKHTRGNAVTAGRSALRCLHFGSFFYNPLWVRLGAFRISVRVYFYASLQSELASLKSERVLEILSLQEGSAQALSLLERSMRTLSV